MCLGQEGRVSWPGGPTDRFNLARNCFGSECCVCLGDLDLKTAIECDIPAIPLSRKPLFRPTHELGVGRDYECPGQLHSAQTLKTQVSRRVRPMLSAKYQILLDCFLF